MSSSPALIRGLLPEDPFVETYVVRPGGATVFALGPDERLTVTDSRGSQAAEVSVLGADGRDDAAALEARADAPATVIRAALADRNGSLLAHELASRGLDPADADGGPALRRVVPARVRAHIPRRASRHGRRRRSRRPHRGRRAPALGASRRGAARRRRAATSSRSFLPLSPSRGSTSGSTAATALAYEVRAGEFIQVIDVEGKQCSDFLAFHRRKLEIGPRARARRDDDALAHGTGVPAARPAREVLRRRQGPADRGGPGHGRPPRHLRPRLHREVLRGQGLPRPRQLHRQLQRGGRRPSESRRGRAGRRSTSSTTPASTRTTCS